jgi:hypothetical protein
MLLGASGTDARWTWFKGPARDQPVVRRDWGAGRARRLLDTGRRKLEPDRQHDWLHAARVRRASEVLRARGRRPTTPHVDGQGNGRSGQQGAPRRWCEPKFSRWRRGIEPTTLCSLQRLRANRFASSTDAQYERVSQKRPIVRHQRPTLPMRVGGCPQPVSEIKVPQPRPPMSFDTRHGAGAGLLHSPGPVWARGTALLTSAYQVASAASPAPAGSKSLVRPCVGSRHQSLPVCMTICECVIDGLRARSR